MSVTKKYLANSISKKLGLSKRDSLFFVTSFFRIIVKNYNNKISINNFGSFELKETPTRIGRNPKTREEKKISERNVVLFKPSNEFKLNINS